MDYKSYSEDISSQVFQDVNEIFNYIDPIFICWTDVNTEYHGYVSRVLLQLNSQMSHTEVYEIVLSALKSGFENMRGIEENSNHISREIILWMNK